MLTSLSVRNLVLIDRLELDFQGGLSVLTGETGAGKSILLDALGLVLGSRAETSLIRHGEEKLGVAAEFVLKDKSHPVFELFKEYELESEEEISIKRVLDTNGKGKIFINDQPITAKLLKEIGKLLVEVHGQFDNQGLLNPANHLSVLDAYGNYPDLLSDVKEKYAELVQARKNRKTAEETLEKATIESKVITNGVDSGATTEGTNSFFSLGIGAKYVLSNGFGVRGILDYYSSNEEFEFESTTTGTAVTTTQTRTLSGPRIQFGLSYRF